MTEVRLDQGQGISTASRSETWLGVVVTGRFPERALITLLVSTAGFTLASAAGWAADQIWQAEDLARYLNVDAEANLPTWLGASLLLLSAVLLAVIAFAPVQARSARGYWLLLSGVFLLLSIDETTRLHESLGEALQRAWETEGLIRFAWILPYGVVGLLLLVALIPFLVALPGRTRNLFLLAGVLYVIGAAGINALTGALIEGDPPQGAITVLGHVEEILEMSGVSLFLFALLDYLRSAVLILEPQSD